MAPTTTPATNNVNANVNTKVKAAALKVLPDGIEDEIVGAIDEAGRGPLAGNVYSACVVMPSSFPPDDRLHTQIKDSKKLSAAKRETLRNYIKAIALTYGVGFATPTEVDAHNILQATFMAMHRAVDEAYAKKPIDRLIVDGTSFKPYLAPSSANLENGWLPHKCYENGDGTYMAIAAASILAKTAHDDHIKALVAADPSLDTKYGWLSNMGYGTKKHMDGLKEWGITPHHRKSFAPVARIWAASSSS